MDRATTAPADRLFCAVELSKTSWLLGIQFPDHQKASVYPIKGGDSEGLMAKLVAARDRWANVSGKKPSIILCYEAGYDAFWLARFLKGPIKQTSISVEKSSQDSANAGWDCLTLLGSLLPKLGAGRQLHRKVDPLPSVDSTQMRPPCISTICLANGETETGAALGPRVRVVDLLELLEDPRLMFYGDAWARVRH
jgi:hypothetical protein